MPIPVTKNKDIILDAQYRILDWDHTKRQADTVEGFHYWDDVKLWVICCPTCSAIFGYPTKEQGETGFWFHQVSC